MTDYPDERDIAYWHPRLSAAGVLTPATALVAAPDGGVPPPGVPAPRYWEFLAVLLGCGRTLGYPFVLRTGLALPKHRWAAACLVGAAGEIDARVRATQAWCDGRGLPVRTWAARQYVPPVDGFAVYDGLPVGREFRVFLRDGRPLCVHPLWPRAAVDAARPVEPHWPDALAALTELRPDTDRKVLLTLARRAATFLPGEWAIDFLATQDGRWVAHSASPSALAWHDPACPHHPAAPGAADRPPVAEAAYSIDPERKADLPLVWLLDQGLEEETPAVPAAGNE